MMLASPSAPRHVYQGDGRRDTARPARPQPSESEIRTKQCGLEPKWLRTGAAVGTGTVTPGPARANRGYRYRSLRPGQGRAGGAGTGAPGRPGPGRGDRYRSLRPSRFRGSRQSQSQPKSVPARLAWGPSAHRIVSSASGNAGSCRRLNRGSLGLLQSTSPAILPSSFLRSCSRLVPILLFSSTYDSPEAPAFTSAGGVGTKIERDLLAYTQASFRKRWARPAAPHPERKSNIQLFGTQWFALPPFWLATPGLPCQWGASCQVFLYFSMRADV